MSVSDDIERAALVQADQLRKAEGRVEVLRGHLGRVRSKRVAIGDDLDALEAQTAALRAGLGLDDVVLDEDPSALDRFDPTPEEFAEIDASLPSFSTLRTVTVGDEAAFRDALARYALDEGVLFDADPITTLLPPNTRSAVQSVWEQDTARLSWDRWDYAIVGGAAVLGALLDVALVAVPVDSLWKGVSYSGSPLTKLLRKKNAALVDGDGWLSRIHRASERWAKVPYDISRNARDAGIDIDGLRPAMHRIMSPGHDPVLGFIFGVIDQIRGTCTLVDRLGVTHVIANGAGVSLPVAIAKQVAHLLSDLPTSAGLPPPFFSALQWITTKTPFAVGPSGESQSVADLTRWMYGRGYDARHFATMSVVPLVVESVVRVAFFGRNCSRLVTDGASPVNLTLKRDEMLLAAHAIAASTNALKVALMQGNPLALNQAVWMSVAASAFRWMKSRGAHDAAVQRELLSGWQSVLAAHA